MKIVINTSYGGFGLSREAINRYCELKGVSPGKWHENYNYYPDFLEHDIPREDAILVQIVEEMGSKADGKSAELKIVNVPDNVNWYIEEYDGKEWVAERHRTWD